MKRTLRLVLLLLSVLLTAALILTGCEKNGGSSTTSEATTPQQTEPQTEPVPEGIVLVENGQPKVRVIRSDSLPGDDPQVRQALTVRDAIGEFCERLPPDISTDWSRDGKYDDGTLEILVGTTAYPQTNETAAGIGYTGYAVRVIGNKIVVFGFSSEALSEAVRSFTRAVRAAGDKENKSLVVKPEDIESSGNVGGLLSTIPTFDGGKVPVFYDPGDKCAELIIGGTNPEGFSAYVAKLEAAGYKKTASNEIKENSFATLNNGKTTVNVGYYAYETSVRIVAEKYSADVEAALGGGPYERVTTAQITMIGLAYTDKDGSEKSNGLSILIRMTDGRFIVVDGGFNRTADSSALIKAIKDQSKDYSSKTGMKIAAWIITHAHGDHMGMIGKQYSTIKSSGIQVENFFINFMSDTERERAISYYLSQSSNHWSNGEGSMYSQIYDAAKALGATPVVVHVGQVFRYSDLDIEVLYTIESHPKKLATALNTTSLVMKMTFTDPATGKKTTYMSTGDATGDAFDVCAKMYGDYLRCDLLQVAHHGGTTWGNDAGTRKAYQLIAPATLVWPCGAAYWPTAAARAWNSVLLDKSTNPNYAEVYVAGWEGSTTIFPMPYTIGSAVQNLTSKS